MEMNWTKRPDCDQCKKPEAGIIWFNRPLCFPCSKKDQARQLAGFLKENLSKEEFSSFIGGGING